MAAVDLLFQGFPGLSPTHGRLGWTTIALIRAEGRNVLVDTGSPGAHPLLLQRLKERGLTAADIHTLVISHSHWDHSIGYPLFPRAELVIGEAELAWALELAPDGDISVPAYLMRHLADEPRLRTVRGDTELLRGVFVIDTPGHTPGHISVVVATQDGPVVLAQDAAKNRVEFLTRTVDMTMDAAASVASIERIASLAGVVVPGHDRPFRIESGRAVYLGELRAEIAAWTGPTPANQTVFSMVVR